MKRRAFENCPVCKRKVPKGHTVRLHFSAKHGAWCNCPRKGMVKDDHHMTTKTGGMGTVMDCPEEGCDGVMVLRYSPKYERKFYGCSNYPRCKAAHGAHPDGTPLGVPADKETKRARIEAHAAFDKLWENAHEIYRDPPVTGRKAKKRVQRIARKRAYAWLREAMEMNEEECHIGKFDKETCARVVKVCEDMNPEKVRNWFKFRLCETMEGCIGLVKELPDGPGKHPGGDS